MKLNIPGIGSLLVRIASLFSAILPGAKTFRAKKRIAIGLPLAWKGNRVARLVGGFEEWFLEGDGKIEPVRRRSQKLQRLAADCQALDKIICEKAGGVAATEILLQDLVTLIKRLTAEHETRHLGDILAFIRDQNGILRTVFCYWDRSTHMKGWALGAREYGTFEISSNHTYLYYPDPNS